MKIGEVWETNLEDSANPVLVLISGIDNVGKILEVCLVVKEYEASETSLGDLAVTSGILAAFPIYTSIVFPESLKTNTNSSFDEKSLEKIQNIRIENAGVDNSSTDPYDSQLASLCSDLSKPFLDWISKTGDSQFIDLARVNINSPSLKNFYIMQRLVAALEVVHGNYLKQLVETDLKGKFNEFFQGTHLSISSNLSRVRVVGDPKNTPPPLSSEGLRDFLEAIAQLPDKDLNTIDIFIDESSDESIVGRRSPDGDFKRLRVVNIPVNNLEDD
jgi:hypothetical protein